MFIIESTGEVVQCHSKEVALDPKNVVVVVSPSQKKIYTWIGKKASPQSKFACARETARMRMETGYKLVTLEGDLTSNEFLQAVDESIAEAAGMSFSSLQSSQPTTPGRQETMPTTKPSESTSTSTTSKVKKASMQLSKPELEAPSSEMENIVKVVRNLPKIENKVCDYLIVDNQLFLYPEKDDVQLDPVKLEDGSFVADDYVPRLLVKEGKVIAIELWRTE